jgi:hypothetical protein
MQGYGRYGLDSSGLGEGAVAGLLGFWTLSIIWYSNNTKNTTFRKEHQFPKRCVLCVF